MLGVAEFQKISHCWWQSAREKTAPEAGRAEQRGPVSRLGDGVMTRGSGIMNTPQEEQQQKQQEGEVPQCRGGWRRTPTVHVTFRPLSSVIVMCPNTVINLRQL